MTPARAPRLLALTALAACSAAAQTQRGVRARRPDGRVFHLACWLGRASYADDAGEPLVVHWHARCYVDVPLDQR